MKLPRKEQLPPEAKTTNLMLWSVPVVSKHRFKEACARKGVTMKEALLRLMCGFANDWYDLKPPEIKRHV